MKNFVALCILKIKKTAKLTPKAIGIQIVWISSTPKPRSTGSKPEAVALFIFKLQIDICFYTIKCFLNIDVSNMKYQLAFLINIF